MGCHGHHAILFNPNRFIFGDHKIFLVFSGPIDRFRILNNCPLVQGMSKKPPPPEVCVWGEGDSYSMILHLFLLS